MSARDYIVEIEKLAKKLVGLKITKIKYMSQKEAAENGWHGRAVVITLEGGIELSPMQDDEGNGPGALVTNIEGELSLFATV